MFHISRSNAAMLCAVALLSWQRVSSAQTPPSSKWQALDTRASELYTQGDLPHAIEAADAALAEAHTPRETGRSLDRLGFLYYTAGKLADAEKYLRQSIGTRQSAFGVDSLEYAETANDLAMLLRDLRRMDEARTLAARAVATRERLLGANALPLAESLNTLASIQGLAGEYAAAVAIFERAVIIHESRPPADRATEEYGTLCVNLAGTYQRLGKYALAETAFEKGLGALKVRPGVAHPAYAASLLAYAALEVELGHYTEAERMYDDGGRLVRAELGEEHPIYATFLNNRGFLYQSIGNASAAAASYQQSLQLKRKLYGPDSVQAVSTLRNLAHLTYQHDPRAGERLLAEAAAAYGRMSTAPPFDFTSVLVGLARAERERGAADDARRTATRALDISRAGLGDAHPLFAAATRELGLALAAAGEDRAAEQRLQEALALAQRTHGPSHPDVAAFLDALAGFYTSTRNYRAAEPLYRQSLDIAERFWSDVLDIGSEQFKAATMATAADPIPTLIAFQARAAAELPSARVLAFEAVARRKGRIVEHVRNWKQQLDETASPAIRARVREWQDVVECRTSLTVALGYRDLKPGVAGACSLAGTDLEGRYERLLSELRTRWTPDVGAQTIRAIATLQERADRLEAALNRDTGGLAPSVAAPTVDDLRRELGADETLIEIVSYAENPSNGGGAARHYGAFVLSRMDLDWADLGAAAPIDAAVADLQEAARDWSISMARHETDAAHASMRTATDALSALSKRVWMPLKPLVARVPSARRLRIAPDSTLNLVPFEALNDGRDLIDRYTISYVPAGRDLVFAGPSVESSPPVVVVSPGAASPRSDTAERSGAFRAARLARLQNAAAEAEDVRQMLPGARIYTGAAATEQHVKSLHRPALIHIVGHGVVRDEVDCPERPCLAGSLDTSTEAMSLAAIVLEEAYGRGAASSDDGMLTALEVENMDLRGTEMVVLSQCQMASGLPSVGEGVYGMRRAAAIAGVRTFVAPLWNVEDGVQRRLMKRFYERLSAGDARGDALRRAKLAIRRTPATSSFLYWAPVILSGSSAALPGSLVARP